MSEDGQQVEINNTGYTGRSIDSTTGEVSPYEVKLTSNTLAFTKDNWKTAGVALGRIITPEGEVYGLVR